MKNLLVVFCLFSMSYAALGQETRMTAIHPSGREVVWGADSEFAQTIKNAGVKGSLTLTRTKPIDSIHPYDLDGGRAVQRPGIIDDIYYESLLLLDPAGGTETVYPLIAQAVRVPQDMSYAVFEIDPRARFQDGTPVKGADILFSLDVLKQSSAEWKNRIDSLVSSSTAGMNEVRIDFRTTGPASLKAILLLGSMKIVKPNTTGATLVGGIRVKYTVTGPYRLTQLGRGRLSLITDPFYWGRFLGVRRGFFNFRAVEVLAYPDVTSARMSIANDTTNFFREIQPGAASFTQKMLKNADVEHTEENATFNGERIPALSFNLFSPAVADWRARAAILLAYDFEQINNLHYAGTLRRPLSLLDGSALAPKGEPSPAVKALMDTCSAPDRGPFESHGHTQYVALDDKRVRLLTAMRLLQEAGFKLENGVLKRPLGNGEFVPLQVRLLVKEKELRAANLFRSDLLRLGILAHVQTAEGENFRAMQAAGQYEMVSTKVGFLDKEGWPSAARLQIGEARSLPCLREMAQTLENEHPLSQTYRDNAEAVARVHEALVLSVFTGAPAKKDFFYDGSLNVPGLLSVEKMHMYGYWVEPERDRPELNPNHFWPAGCVDLGCLFGPAR